MWACLVSASRLSGFYVIACQTIIFITFWPPPPPGTYIQPDKTNYDLFLMQGGLGTLNSQYCTTCGGVQLGLIDEEMNFFKIQDNVEESFFFFELPIQNL